VKILSFSQGFIQSEVIGFKDFGFKVLLDRLAVLGLAIASFI